MHESRIYGPSSGIGVIFHMPTRLGLELKSEVID